VLAAGVLGAGILGLGGTLSFLRCASSLSEDSHQDAMSPLHGASLPLSSEFGPGLSLFPKDPCVGSLVPNMALLGGGEIFEVGVSER
jgi:hypothetical protein